MPFATGYMRITDRTGLTKTIEIDTVTCGHCQRVVLLHEDSGKRIEDAHGVCLVCQQPKCDACRGKGCTPFERRLEASEARGRLLRSIGGE